MAPGGQKYIGVSQCEYSELLNPEDGTDILSRNVDKKLPLLVA